VVPLVTRLTLRCSWWGRHEFTSLLSPVHLALRESLLRGPNSAVSSTTAVVVSPASLVLPALSQCAVLLDNQVGGSWSVTQRNTTSRRHTVSNTHGTVSADTSGSGSFSSSDSSPSSVSQAPRTDSTSLTLPASVSHTTTAFHSTSHSGSSRLSRTTASQSSSASVAHTSSGTSNPLLSSTLLTFPSASDGSPSVSTTREDSATHTRTFSSSVLSQTQLRQAPAPSSWLPLTTSEAARPVVSALVGSLG
jgi:trimeric autotransporter adhesin